MILTQPVFKKNYYLSKTVQPVQYDVIDCHIKSVKKLDISRGVGSGGYLLCIHVKNSDFLHQFDEDIVNTIVENNKAWFKNDLVENEIRQLYTPSVCSQNHTLNVILCDNSKIYMNNKIQELSDLENDFKNVLFFRKSLINMTIQHHGLYIHAKQTYNRWVIRTLHIYNEDESNDVDDSKEDIEESWKVMVSECNEILNNKIKLIQNTQNNIQSLYAEAVQEKNKSRAWEEKIRQLKTLIQNIIF